MMIELRCKIVDFPAASSQHGVISPPIPGKSSDLSESSARTAPMSASSPIHLVDGGISPKIKDFGGFHAAELQ